MTSLTRLLPLTVCLGLASILSAAPNFLGPTGMLLTPTAETLTEDRYNLNLFAFEDTDSEQYAFNYGVRENLEVGFSRLPNKETIVNAKYNFQPEIEKTLGLSVGVIDATDQDNATLYGVASKRLDVGDLYLIDNVRAHLGLGTGENESVIGLNGLFGGLSFDVATAGTLLFEHDGDSFNYGARVNFSRSFTAQLGIVGDSSDFVIGASYTGNL